MNIEVKPKYWIFSNKPEGFYQNNLWDLATNLRSCKYTIKEHEMNRKRVMPGDIVYLRIYGRSIIGKFVVDDPWKPLPKKQQLWKVIAGNFRMKDLVLWKSPLPQNIILGFLSNQNHRHRIVGITEEDSIRIETAQRVYERLGFGGTDKEIVILEKGLEEAIKPNLPKLGLKLANKRIQQQFSMGIGVGRSDLICMDENDDFVIIELKRGMTSDETIGQVLRYVGWARENLCEEGQKVSGWIVAGDYDEQLRLAASAAEIKLVLIRLG